MKYCSWNHANKIVWSLPVLAVFALFISCASQTGQENRKDRRSADDTESVQSMGKTGETEPIPGKKIRNMEFPPLEKFTPPRGEKVTLNNDIPAYLLKDDELPLVRLQLTVRTGSFYDPAKQVGLASITGSVLRTGGTKSLTPDQLNRKLENRAAHIEVSVGNQKTEVTVSCLKKNFDSIYKLFLDILKNPAFRKEKIQVKKKQMKSAIQRRNDQPRQIASRERDFLLYGRDSIYAREIEPWNLANIDRSDLVEFHDKYFHAGNYSIGVVGDIDQEQIMEKLNSTLGKQKVKESDPLDLPEVDSNKKRVVALGHKGDLTKSFIYMAHHCDVSRGDQDYGPLFVASRILGSGTLSSRLFNRVRSDAGLAYSVGGGFSANYGYPGVFYTYVGTKSKTTTEAIKLVLNTVKEMTEEKVTQEELSAARDSILDSLVFSLKDPERNLNRQMSYEFFGVPENWIETFQQQVQQTTREDVLRVAQKYFRPEEFIITVVGNRNEIEGDLKQFGNYREIDISLPEPPEGEQETVQGDKDKGNIYLKKWQNAIPDQPFQKMKAISLKATLETKARGRKMTREYSAYRTLDGRERITMTMRGMNVDIIVGKDRGWLNTPRGVRKMPPSQLKQYKTQHTFRYVTGILNGIKNGHFTVSYIGRTKVDGKEYIELKITKGENTAHVLLKPDSMQVYQVRIKSSSGADRILLYKNYRDVDGLNIPHMSVSKSQGGQKVTRRIENVKLLEKVDESKFEKPGNNNSGKNK